MHRATPYNKDFPVPNVIATKAKKLVYTQQTLLKDLLSLAAALLKGIFRWALWHTPATQHSGERDGRVMSSMLAWAV
jgi:hypothetical protein